MNRPVLVVLRALGLGDFLTGIPALRALADAFPDHHRVLAAPAGLEPLVRLTHAVDEVLPHDGLRHVKPLRRPREPVVAVNLHGRGPDSHRALLALRPERLVAFAHPEIAVTHGGPQWREDEHEVTRWCRMLAESGIAASPDRLDLDVAPLAPTHHRATVIHPGAASEARRWPAERWAAVARHEQLAGRDVLITGSRDEVQVARTVANLAGLGPEAVVAGRTNLVQLATLVAGADVVLSGDTGVAHLATALRRTSVVLFGPTPPSRWGPPPHRTHHRVLWAGRTGDPHGSVPHEGLLAITVEQALAALDEVRTVNLAR